MVAVGVDHERFQDSLELHGDLSLDLVKLSSLQERADVVVRVETLTRRDQPGADAVCDGMAFDSARRTIDLEGLELAAHRPITKRASSKSLVAALRR